MFPFYITWNESEKQRAPEVFKVYSDLILKKGHGTKTRKRDGCLVKRDTCFSILCIFKEKVYTFAEYYDKQDPIDGHTFSLYLCLVKKLVSIARYKSLNTSNQMVL